MVVDFLIVSFCRPINSPRLLFLFCCLIAMFLGVGGGELNGPWDDLADTGNWESMIVYHISVHCAIHVGLSCFLRLWDGMIYSFASSRRVFYLHS